MKEGGYFPGDRPRSPEPPPRAPTGGARGPEGGGGARGRGGGPHAGGGGGKEGDPPAHGRVLRASPPPGPPDLARPPPRPGWRPADPGPLPAAPRFTSMMRSTTDPAAIGRPIRRSRKMISS